MWQLIKTETIYNKYQLLALGFTFILYSTFSVFDLQITTAPEFEIDYWGGIYGIFIYAFLISIWGTRIKEKRIRYYSLLPITQKSNSHLRFWIAFLPFFILIIYLIIINLIIIKGWHTETGSIIGQVGVCLILFAGFIRGRDDWFSYWEFGKRTRAAFITVLIIHIVVVFVFLEMDAVNKVFINSLGVDAFHYAKLIFFLLGLLILITSVYSFRKRRVFLK